MVAMTQETKEEERMMENDRLVAFNIRNIPLGLRRRFKMKCAECDTNMERQVVKLIEDFVGTDFNELEESPK